MRILQINCVYKVGSTGKIVDCIGKVLRDLGHDVLTCYGIGDKYYDDHSIKICSDWEHKINALLMRIKGIPYGGIFLSNQRLYRIIKSFNPDVVHVHCVNASMINVYQLFRYLGKKNIRTVLTLHAEIYHTAGCEHAFECDKFKGQCHNCSLYCKESWLFHRTRGAWHRMYNAINSFPSECLAVTAVSPWLKDRAEQSSMLSKFKVNYVPNGIDTSLFYPHNHSGKIDRTGYRGVVLFVTSIFSLNETDQKGGRFILELAKLMPQVKFVVVASRSVVSVKIQQKNVQFLGQARTQSELAQLYSEADISLILSRREAFSMVTAESLCCGTPVVGFKAGGPDSIAIRDYSSFVEYGNLEALSEAIYYQIDREIDKECLSAAASNFFSKENMAGQYLRRYEDIRNKEC